MTKAVATLLPLTMAAVIVWSMGASFSAGQINLYRGRRAQRLVIMRRETVSFWSMMLLMSLVVGVLLLSVATE